MKQKRFIKIRRELGELLSQIGSAADKHPKNKNLESAYRDASKALDALECYGVDKTYLDPITHKAKRKT